MAGVVVARTLLLLLLWVWFDRCEGLNDSSLPAIFYPFGRDEGDRVIPVGYSCKGPIQMPSAVFGKRRLYVSWSTVIVHTDTQRSLPE